MKKIVPFTKDLMFKTKIGEITSIGLDHTLKLDSGFISGEFIISGTYKMLEDGNLEEAFKYQIPVDITIDNKYDTSKCNISIDDFSYEIINEERLKTNISVVLDDLELKNRPIETISLEVNDERDSDLEFLEEKDINEIEIPFEKDNESKTNNIINDYNDIDVSLNKNTNVLINNKDDKLFNIDSEKEYSIYRVYTVKEDDTLDLIYEKFQTTKEILSEYNDLDNIVVGSKIIIPSQDE